MDKAPLKKLPGAPHFATFRDLLKALAHIYEKKDVFRVTDGSNIVTTSAEEFTAIAQRIGAALYKNGTIQKVAVIGETSPLWVASYFGVVCGGGTVIPIDRELPPAEIANILNQSGASALICSPSCEQTIEKIKAKIPYVQDFVTMGKAAPGSFFTEIKTFTSNIDGVTLKTYDEIKTYPDDVCALLFTSGTTGVSKGVMLTQKNLLENSRGHTEFISLSGACLSTLPIHHTYEFSIGILGSMMSGLTICINDSLRNYMKNLRLFSPQIIYVVPAFIEMLYAKIEEAQKANGTHEIFKLVIQNGNSGAPEEARVIESVSELLGGNLKTIICGGAPLPSFYVDIFANLNIPLLQGYGITECSPLISINPEWHNVPGSVGRPISCCEVKIESPDKTGCGEIAVKGANVMKGYYNSPKATDAAFKDGWFLTGDIGHIDQNGHIYITGRKKNVIVLQNGKNIYPEELESYFSRIPYIKEIIVFAQTDKNGFETVLTAEIYPDPKTKESMGQKAFVAMLEADMAKINRELPFYKQVHKYKIRKNEFKKTTKQSIKRFKTRAV